MEGYFWRVADTANQRVLVVLCGVNRHPDGAWATVAIAAHPGGFVRAAVLDRAAAASDRFLVTAGDGAFTATASEVHVDLGPDARADLSLSRPVTWPLVLGGGGLFSVLPFLGQYWHPHLLGGAAGGTARVGDQEWELIDADVYAEKNWGAGFPERWVVGSGPGLRPARCMRRLRRRLTDSWTPFRARRGSRGPHRRHGDPSRSAFFPSAQRNRRPTVGSQGTRPRLSRTHHRTRRRRTTRSARTATGPTTQYRHRFRIPGRTHLLRGDRTPRISRREQPRRVGDRSPTNH